MDQLLQLIVEAPPPKTFHPGRSESGIIHADTARNITNLARVYHNHLASKILIINLQEDIYKYCDIDDILQFNNIKWWHDILVREMEMLRENSNEYYEHRYNNLVETYNSLEGAIKNPDQFFKYIE